MSNYKTPGVYIREEDAFGSSIVANATAVPIFIGFTEKAIDRKGKDLTLMESKDKICPPIQIESILEYQQHFGGADITGEIYVTENKGEAGKVYYTSDIKKKDKAYTPGYLFPSLLNYFKNGGGTAYVISLGKYDDFDEKSPPGIGVLKEAIELAEEATLILPVDYLRYEKDNYYSAASDLIKYCADSKLQLCILDVHMADKHSEIYDKTDITGYRDKVTGEHLKYAAAYFPFLNSLTPYAYDEEKLHYPSQSSNGDATYKGEAKYNFKDQNGQEISDTFFTASYNGAGQDPKVNINPGAEFKFEIQGDTLMVYVQANKEIKKEEAENKWRNFQGKKAFSLDNFQKLPKLTDVNFLSCTLDKIPSLDGATKAKIKAYLATNYIPMPSSPFVAGIYARVDNDSGVWTPPANVAPLGVLGPVVNLTDRQQKDVNVDANAGKSINAIRSFTGRGTLVWGARTNAGNSNDWRYVNVVRLFISMENDISKAMEPYVFKPNVTNTWVEVKTMIELYLFGLWQAGAFAGSTPDSSYQVLIGKGVTMTDDEINNGLMKVSIKVAPVRPAEFIELTFSQMVGQ